MNFFVEAASSTATTAESNYQSVSDFWLFVVYCLVVIVVVIFFSFYFNRVLGQVVTFLINQYTWRKHNAYIEVDSIRMSLLGGRILFKNLRYFSTNQSISILKGHIAVRYWLLHVRKSGEDKNGKTSNYPCRIACSVEGLEWFFYNNVPAYDRMKEMLGLSPERNDDYSAKSEKENFTNLTVDTESAINMDNSLFQRILPIQFECATGSVMIGNTSIKSMLVCKADQANGIYSVTRSRSSLDHYKSMIDLILKKPQFNLKENMDYNAGDENGNEIVAPVREITLVDFVLKPLRRLYPFTRSRQFGEMQHLHDLMGEGRNQDSRESANATYHEEYARVVNVLECSEISLTYYADYAGPVPSSDESNMYSGIGIDIGNGGLPPEWGIRISAWDAIFHYGPWTDMQRSEMQDYFFPNAHRKNVPTTKLVPGQQRVATAFETYIEFMNECSLRIPTREKSKDWKYAAGTADLDIGSDGYYTRPYGWLNIKANEGSFIKVVTPYVCGPDGYTNVIDVVLKDADLTSSVNYASFIQLNSIDIHADMPSPLEWNGARQWDFKINAKKPILFLLRDHIYLVQDLLKYWNSSPPPDLLHFTPMTYQLQLNFDDPIIYLCVNEHNIIRYPNSIEDNAYLKLQSQYLSFNITFPFTEYQPETTSLKFSVNARNTSAGLSLQTSHTFSSFMREEDANTAVVVDMTIDGTYEYYSTVDILRHIESCNLDVKINGATVKLFGTLIRYLFILRDNYFGEWDHFLTIDEYRKQRNNPQEWQEQKKKQVESKPLADPFEVYVLFELEDGVMLFPENLYECSSYSQFEFQQLQVEVRNLDVYLDMYMNISPITLSRNIASAPQPKEGFFRVKDERDPKNYIYIDGLNIYAHRLFGPLPECATYLCHWEFDVGRITGEIKPSFLLGLACFGQTFAYNLIDEDNAVPQEMKSKELPDVSFVKLYIQEVDICLMSMSSATNFSLKDGILVEFDNLINAKYSQRITIKIPTILTRFLANPDQARTDGSSDENNEYPWVEVAKADLGLNITVFRHTALWKKARSEQQNFIRTQDYPTRRCVRLYEEVDTDSRSSFSSARSVGDHQVGILYAPPFRPFMFGRVEDKSVLHDVSNYKAYTPMSERSSYVNYYDSEHLSSDESSSLSGSNRESFQFDDDSYSGFSAPSDAASYTESFHTANESDDSNSPSFDNYSYSSTDGSYESSGEVTPLSRNESESENRNKSPKKTVKTAIPPSIPYGDYLRRYKVKRPYSSYGHGEFFHPYLPPAHPQFIPEKHFEEKAQRIYESTENFDQDYFTKDNSGSLYSEEDTQTSDAFGKGNEVIATTVIEATRPVTVLVTPIIIKIIQELAEEIVKDDWDLESMLDALQMNYIEQLTRYLTDQYICTRFAVILPHVYLRCIQNVIIPDGLPSYKHGETFIKTQYNLEDTVLCSGDIFLHDFKMIGSVKFEDYAYQEKMDKVAESNLKLQELRLHIDVGEMGSTVQYVSKQYDRSSFSFGIPYEYIRNKKFYTDLTDEDVLTSELIVLDFALSGFGFKLLGARIPNYVELNVNNVDSVIITESVEILVGAIYSWLVFVDDLKGILESFQDRRSRQVQVFINEIANFSNTQGVVSDPIFLTAPSTMLRLGSRNFRNDCGWKLLAHMRHCLRLMPLSNREELQYRLTSGNTLQNIKSDEMFNNIVETFSHWRSWEVGYDDVIHCRLFTQPFEKSIHKQGDNPTHDMTNEVIKLVTTSSNFAKIRLEAFKFTVFEEETTTFYKVENSISIGPLEFLFECLFKKSMLPAPDDSYTTEDEQLRASVMDKYLDIIARVNLGKIAISVNPIIMAFARHMILVQRVFTSKMLNLQHAIKISTTTVNTDMEINSPISSALDNTAANQEFDFDTLLSRVDVVAQALINFDQIQIAVHVQDLRMDANVIGIQGSALFSNPKLAPLQLFSHGDHDSDTASNKRSSTRGRKNTHSDPRLVLEAVCGIRSTDVQFSEELNVSNSVGSDILLGITLDRTNINANLSQVVKISKKHNKSESTKDILNVFSNIHRFRIHMPQSLLKLYGFVESWQSQQGSRFHFLFQNLVREWEEQRREYQAFSRPASMILEEFPSEGSSVPLDNSTNTKKMDLKLQVLLNEFHIQADLLSSLSVEYKIVDFFSMVNKVHHKTTPVYTYAFQLSKQVIHLITQDTTKESSEAENETNSTFSVPGIRSTGSLKSETLYGTTVTNLRSMISIDVISMSLDASLIDSLLTAQSLLGNEISELVEVISFAKPKKSLNVTPSKTSSSRALKYTVDISLDGLSISASSPAAVGMFRSNVLEASISNEPTTSKGQSESLDQLTWKLNAENFSLSLDHNTTNTSSNNFSDSSYRRNCLAYILVNFSIQNYLPVCNNGTCDKNTHAHDTDAIGDSIYINFSKIQTVMQPIALGKLAEISIYYETELRKKKLMKKAEIDQLSANTKRIVQTISSRNNWPKALQEDSGSLLEGKIINLNMRRIGIAIPLDSQSDLPVSDLNKGNGALLLSIGSIEFLTKNIEKNALQLDNTTLQFVKKFDQSKTDHFIAEKHPQMNQITFPLITCHVSATNEKPLQAILADAHVRGFDIDVDGNIAEYINTLNSIYNQCKDRVDSFTTKANLNSENTQSSLPAQEADSDFEIVKLKFECKLTCESGHIRMYPKKHSSDAHKNKKRIRELRLRTGLQPETSDGNTVIVSIPGLSAWVTYQTPLGAHATTADSPKRLHGDVLILESVNTIHPAVVQFLREVTSDLKIGIQQSSEQKAVQSPASVVESNMNISLFLRLSKTQLDLTCQPISKVVCSLGWEESEFLVNSFSNDTTSRSLSCVGSIRAITSVIKHHFSPEPCLNTRVDRILFNVMLTSQRQNSDDDDISIILEIPNVIGDLNMRHLQDLLILRSCWFTEKDLTEAHTRSGPSTPKLLTPSQFSMSMPNIRDNQQLLSATPKVSAAPFSKHVAVLIKGMKFSVDLSQHIGNITFIPTFLSIQMHHIPFETKGASLTLDDIKIASEGRLSGSSNFKRTVIGCRVDQSLYEGHHREKAFVCARSDGFTAAFQYEYQNIIDVIQHSLEFNADYRRVSAMYEIQVSIQLEALIARLSVKTVPVLITIAQKFKELLQKKQAEASFHSGYASKHHKKHAVPQPRSNNNAYELSSVQSQTLLAIKAIEVIIYPSQFEDTDNVNIRAKEFKIHLEEFPRTDTGVHRKLKLKIASAALAKNVPGKDLMVLYNGALTFPITKPKNMGGTKIFGIPETNLVMESTELRRNISYTFDAIFAGRVSVSLNIGLIKYLQEMTNMFNMQLDRALERFRNNGDRTRAFEENEDITLSLDDNDNASPVASSSTAADSGAGSSSRFTYTAINSVNFQPQLQVMGDATPPVEWLGLNRERIPGLIHENITLHLDELIGALWDVLEKQADS